MIHGSVFESGDVVGKLADESGRYFAFLGDNTSQLANIILHILKHQTLVKAQVIRTMKKP